MSKEEPVQVEFLDMVAALEDSIARADAEELTIIQAWLKHLNDQAERMKTIKTGHD